VIAAQTADVLLVIVFLTAAGAKLADLSGTREAVVAFGAPARLSAALAAALVAAELTVAGLLLTSETATAGAAGALALLVLFSAAITLSLARGAAPECHCFGQLHSEPAGWKTLARNAGLAALAALVLAAALTGHRASAFAWVGGLDETGAVALGAGVAVAAVLVAATIACLSVLRSYGRVLVRLDRVEHLLAENGLSVEDDGDGQRFGLEPGTPAPAFPELAELLAPGLPIILLFTSPDCGPCRALLPEAAAWQIENRDVVTVAAAVEGNPAEVSAEAARNEFEHAIADESLDLYRRFGANGTPSGVLIESDGTIASWVASGAESIRSLVGYVLASPAEPGLPVGADLPPLELPALDGEHVRLDALHGRETLLVFWNPGCGYCRAMHDDLVGFERSVNREGPRLVVVSSGDAGSTREEDFRSLVLIDRDFTAGATLGATGTPSGLLLDAGGRVASKVAVGADAILELTRRAMS
jgi:thiol-disulfide isomerase/thioredoxin